MKLLATQLSELKPGPIRDYMVGLFQSEEMDENESFQFNIGGDLFVVETLDDLKEISDGRANLFYEPIQLDVVELLTPELCMVCNITNNSGGNTYFINRAHFTQTLVDSIYNFNKGKTS